MKNKTILLSPHMDDEGLFASYIILQNKPLTVVIVYDGNQHKRKFNIALEIRRNESIKACKFLGARVVFLGLSDEEYDSKKVNKALLPLQADLVFVPALQGGNRHHDIVSAEATKIFPNIKYYATYTKDNLTPQGNIAVMGDWGFKGKILNCYKSQHNINLPHFQAVKEVPEWLM